LRVGYASTSGLGGTLVSLTQTVKTTMPYENLDRALTAADASLGKVWDNLLGDMVTASVGAVKNPQDATQLLDRLESIHGHLVNMERVLQTYNALKVPGSPQESTGTLLIALQELSMHVNQDIQVLKRKTRPLP
jgi:hypothetical protein